MHEKLILYLTMMTYVTVLNIETMFMNYDLKLDPNNVSKYALL